MGKKARKRSSIAAKENASCLWSFVSIFEVNQSYNLRKLLADRKRGSARYNGTSFLGNNLSGKSWGSKCEHDTNEADGHGDAILLSRLPSVKVLIEEEMSKEKVKIFKSSDCNNKSNRKTIQNHKKDSDSSISILMNSAHVVLEQFKSQKPVEGSSLIFDLASLMIEFYSVSCYSSDTCKEIEVDLSIPSNSNGRRKLINFDESDSQHAFRQSMMLQEALIAEAEAFLSQKIDDAKHLSGNGAICSQEFMDALEILNSNKELFLKLIQDPNLLVLKHIHELLKAQITDFSNLDDVHSLDKDEHLAIKLVNSVQNEESISNQVFQKKKQHFLLKKWEEATSKIGYNSQEMSRIVVLKPSLLKKNRGDSTQNHPRLPPQPDYSSKNGNEDNERTAFHFSFREIKRKLKRLIGESRKQQHSIFEGSILNGYEGSADICRMTSTETAITDSTSQTECSTDNICHTFSAFEKADKKAEKEYEQRFKDGTAQCKILPVSLFHTERFDEEGKHVYEPQLIDGSDANLSRENLVEISRLCSAEIAPINTKIGNDRVSLRGETCNGEKLNADGRYEIAEIVNVKSVRRNSAEECYTLYMPAESVDSVDSSCERCQGSSSPSNEAALNHKPTILIPTASVSPTSLIIKHSVSSEFIEKQDRPSPVSVLDQFFLEDDASPDRPSLKIDEKHKSFQPIHLNFHEDPAALITPPNCLTSHKKICSYDMEIMLKKLGTILETHSLDSEWWPSSEELVLHPLLVDEIKALLYSFPEDPKLLFDRINEVFAEKRDRQFHLSPFIKPTVQPFMKNAIIKEVCEAIESYISLQFQSTLSEIVRKDMRGAMWMDRLEMGCIIAGMACRIIEDLVEEAIFELFLESCKCNTVVYKR